MRITNNHNLPEPIYNAVCNTWAPKPNRFSVTDLINAPLQRILKMKYWDKLEQDASDMLWALLGKSVHAILEPYSPAESFSEEKLETTINGSTVVCVADLYHNEIISDYKITSVYAFLLGDKPEWEQQLNLYALLYGNKLELVVAGLKINAILRDWTKSKSLKDSNYPATPFHSVDVPLWSTFDQYTYLIDRLNRHQQAEAHMDAPVCTDEERWARPDKWAVIKEGRKTALRVLDSEEAALQWIEGYSKPDKKKLSVDFRQGEYTKCRDYCIVRQVCEFNPYTIAKTA